MSFSQLTDAVYALDVDEETWIRELSCHARPLLDDGAGLFAYSYALIGDEVKLDAVAIEGTAASHEVWGSLNDWGHRNQAIVATLYRARPIRAVAFESVARVSRQALWDLRATFEPHRVRDMLAFVAHHRAGCGVILTVPLEGSRGTSRALERTFSNVGSTLAGIVHLRRQRQAVRAGVVLSPLER